MKRRRIAHIIESTTGGTRRHLMDIVNGIDTARYELHVICATRRDPSFFDDIDAMRAAGIPVHIVPMVRAISPRRDLGACLEIRRLLRARRFDGVHTHSSKAGVIGRIAARLARVPVIVHTPHVWPFDMRAGNGARMLYRLIERRLARFTDRIVCVSRAGMDAATAAGVAPAGQYDIIVNGVDIRDFEPMAVDTPERKADMNIPADALVVGAAGRLTPQKNFGLLIDAAARVCKALPETRFVILGDGKERHALERRITGAGLQDRVFMPGTKEDIYSWYPLFDVFAMSSDWEGMPYSLLEAMAARRPVAATAVGGVVEAVRNGRNGILTAPGRPEDMAAALLELLRAPAADRERMGLEARRTVEQHFSKQAMLSALHNLYNQTMEA